MKRNVLILNVVLVLALALSACAPQQPTAAAMTEKDEMMTDSGKDAAMGDKTDGNMVPEQVDSPMAEAPGAMDKPVEQHGDPMVEMPQWFSYELSNAADGAVFKIADFKGKVVVVEFMAMWCSNCLKQQKEVKALSESLGMRDDLMIVAIDVDVNEQASDLSQYAENNGFGWTYTVASLDLAREISAAYGSQFINPPSTPMLVIDRAGNVTLLPFGFKSMDDLKNIIQPLLDAGM